MPIHVHNVTLIPKNLKHDQYKNHKTLINIQFIQTLSHEQLHKSIDIWHSKDYLANEFNHIFNNSDDREDVKTDSNLLMWY